MDTIGTEAYSRAKNKVAPDAATSPTISHHSLLYFHTRSYIHIMRNEIARRNKGPLLQNKTYITNKIMPMVIFPHDSMILHHNMNIIHFTTILSKKINLLLSKQ